jgi:HSP20 family molecular chaperone IbpA
MSTQNIPNEAIRSHYDQNSGKWLFSIVDAVGITTKTTDARNYWKVLKNRLKKAQNQLVTKCNQVKMEARDGKFYLTDVADEQTILKIIELISRENIPSLRYYFDDFRDNVAQKPGFVASLLNRNSGENEVGYPQDEFPEHEKEIKNLEESTTEEMMLMIDGYHTSDALIVKAFVAGVDIDDLFISSTSKILTIKGKRKIQRNLNENNYSNQELYWGEFSRDIKLPYDIKVDEIEASESHGLVTIKLPLINKLESKRIRISSI